LSLADEPRKLSSQSGRPVLVQEEREAHTARHPVDGNLGAGHWKPLSKSRLPLRGRQRAWCHRDSRVRRHAPESLLVAPAVRAAPGYRAQALLRASTYGRVSGAQAKNGLGHTDVRQQSQVNAAQVVSKSYPSRIQVENTRPATSIAWLSKHLLLSALFAESTRASPTRTSSTCR
jgi:hypothetical protein